MGKLALTKTRLAHGIWEGVLSGAGHDTPQLRVTHQGKLLDGPDLQHDPDQNVWLVSISIPARLISDGVQTFVISDAQDNTLGSFTLMSDEVMEGDLRAEIALLRSELEMLKQSFRRHCSEG
ncbi:hypothetical protein [Yoonia sp. 2307UL14-13]|uniref:hypothetical protein n=1 Tax=Yoonia sp. 2307UL14-13 TaxID=3126506 RepID=UPI0030B2DA26